MSTKTPGGALLAAGVEDHIFTHAAAAIACGRGRATEVSVFGAATAETVFDLASLTKPMATATGILQLTERGLLHLREPAAGFFADAFGPLPHLDGIEIRHLLTHTSGLPPLPEWRQDAAAHSRDDFIAQALATPPQAAPGTTYVYSDAGYILLGEIVARVSGLSLSEYFATHIAGPLGLTQTAFGAAGKSEVARTSRAAAPGTVHDPRARDLGGVAGHAGLFGTAADVLTFADAIRCRDGSPILSPASIARMRTSQIPADVGAHSCGWFCAGNAMCPSGDLFSDRAFGHSGFTGCVLMIDPVPDVSVVLLTNRVVNDAEDSSRYLRLRRCWLNAVAAAVEWPAAREV